MSEDWSISPPLPDKVFPWEKYNPVTREEVNEFFHSPEILVIKERMCDIGRRLWNREYVDGNGGNISVRVAQNLLLCSPTLCSKGFMTVEDICMVDMDARQKAGIQFELGLGRKQTLVQREPGECQVQQLVPRVGAAAVGETFHTVDGITCCKQAFKTRFGLDGCDTHAIVKEAHLASAARKANG